MSLQKQGSGGPEHYIFPKQEDVVPHRAGDVLIKNTLLKADHFPGCQNTNLTPLLEGAPNFRQIESLPVYGVAIPTVRGLRSVLDAVGAYQGKRKVLWHNMREEPVLYINGKPYVVREADQPFCNVEYTGIDRSRVEDMEVRLKRDVLREAQLYDGHVLVTEEDDDMQVIEAWEPVTEADVQTPLEAYAEIKQDGYDVDYLRVPITDEKAPKNSDFELLVQRCWNAPEGAALIFNCQMGRGRTTTGTVIATLVRLRKIPAFPPGSAKDAATAAAQQGEGTVAPKWFSSSRVALIGAAGAAPVKDKLKDGMYGVVRSLLRVLERGILGKAILDTTLDACSAMQNLREAIATYRQRLLNEQKEHKRATLMAVCLEYLERYYMLIAFASYLAWPQFNPDSASHVTFQDWTDSRPELRSVLSRMLRRNPMAALELHIPAATLPPGSTPQLDSDENQQLLSQAEAQADRIMEARAGAVLGPFTILKEDYFPGMKSTKLPQTVAGASNFRCMRKERVYGVAMSTLAGIRNVLRAVQQQQRRPDETILWFNMREEPVVFVNGRPFVLREQHRPMKNLQEYAGIDADRLERMEQRLKEDVLAESNHYGGRILVALESITAAGGRGELVDTWEWVANASAVQTPAEVYAMLRQEGFNVEYTRIPVTDGMAPQPSDIDMILETVRKAGFGTPMVFNCQMGAGRTTTGTVIGGLLQEHAACLLQTAGSSASMDLTTEQLQTELQGASPKSEDDERDGGGDHFMGINLFDMTPEQVEEQKSLAAGGYVGVRRVVRLLEEGDRNKHEVDEAIDANAQLLNLRISIMKYRRPRNSYKNHKSEVRARHSAFTRGSSYLERYCLLIAFNGYLRDQGLTSSTTFMQWLEGRPELLQALDSIHSNPATALAAVPVTPVTPLVFQPVQQGQVVTPEEQQHVLGTRKGRTLNRRIILKSYLSRAPDPSLPPGTPDLRQASHLPIYTIGNSSCSGLRKLLTHLGAGPGGDTHVVLTDVREELVVYVNGVPYTRRELEMPAAALHHAGVHARSLESLEAAMKEDVTHEALRWGGRVLLHQEVAAPQHMQTSSSGRHQVPLPVTLVDSFLTPPNAPVSPLGLGELFASPAPAAAAAAAAAAGGTPVGPLAAAGAGLDATPHRLDGMNGAAGGLAVQGKALTPFAKPPTTPVGTPAAAAAATGPPSSQPAASDGFPGFSAPSDAALGPTSNGQAGAAAVAAARPQQQPQQEDVTAVADARPGAAVAPFWEQVDVSAAQPSAADAVVDDSPSARERAARTSPVSWKQLATCLEVAKHLQAEGYQISYRRIPLSRERTPVAGDLDALHKQMLLQQLILSGAAGEAVAGPGSLGRSMSVITAAAAEDAGRLPPRRVLHLVLSRTATGSSARFAASGLATFLIDPSSREQGAALKGGSPTSSGDGSELPPAAKRLKRTMSDLGEYRCIMSLSRLLPGGMEVKSAVDGAVDRCSSIGNLRQDIKRCKHLAEVPSADREDPGSSAWAARQLGVHYLKRYFLLICFRCYLVQRMRQESLGQATITFNKWVEDRKELGHLLHHVTLDT